MDAPDKTATLAQPCYHCGCRLVECRYFSDDPKTYPTLSDIHCTSCGKKYTPEEWQKIENQAISKEIKEISFWNRLSEPLL